MLRLTNLPWSMTRRELERVLSKMLQAPIPSSRLLYDRDTGLSRGIAFVQLNDPQLIKDVVRRGTLTIQGRNIGVMRERSDQRSQPAK